MSEVIRNEEWSIEVDWGISTMVVQVWDSPDSPQDVVRVFPEFFGELGLNLEDYPEKAHLYQEAFVREVPYEVLRAALMAKGFSYVRTT